MSVFIADCCNFCCSQSEREEGKSCFLLFLFRILQIIFLTAFITVSFIRCIPSLSFLFFYFLSSFRFVAKNSSFSKFSASERFWINSMEKWGGNCYAPIQLLISFTQAQVSGKTGENDNFHNRHTSPPPILHSFTVSFNCLMLHSNLDFPSN